MTHDFIGKLLGMLLVGLLTLATYGQSASDSVGRWQNRMTTYSRADSSRIRLLIQQARTLQRAGKLSRSRDAAQEALTLAERFNNYNGQVLALGLLGQFWLKVGELPTARGLFQESRRLAQQHRDWGNVAEALRQLSDVERHLGNYAPGLEYALASLRYAQRSGQGLSPALSQLQLGLIYVQLGEYKQAMSYLNQALTAFHQQPTQPSLALTLNAIGESYRYQHQWTQALPFYKQAIAIDRANGDSTMLSLHSGNLAYVYEKQEQHAQALAVAKKAFAYLYQNESTEGIAWLGSVLAQIYSSLDRPALATQFARQSLLVARQAGIKECSRDASHVLATTCAQRGKWDQAYRYQHLYMTYDDSISGEQTQRRVAALRLGQELDKKQGQITLLEQARWLEAKETRRQRLLLLWAMAGMVLSVVLAGIFWHSNRQRQRANRLLEAQRHEIQLAYDHLQVAQTQLVQSERLASLGELTAGIAHELQNPLNFVTNFSEVSTELLAEQKTALDNGHTEEALLLAEDLTQNLLKIHHHGGRAAAIIKGMLSHSRGSSGRKEPTNLNTLAEEYLKLTYHGMRAKDKTFTCELITQFDTTLGTLNLMPQELGRVLVNLFSNGFYAVRARQQQAEPGYQPTLTVTTLRTHEGVQLRVADNGTGMSESVQAKIFQPFFTTKPTGQGTGLGLSLSYDIITKGHGGSWRVESQLGQGSEFIITLPNT